MGKQQDKDIGSAMETTLTKENNEILANKQVTILEPIQMIKNKSPNSITERPGREEENPTGGTMGLETSNQT